MATETFGSKLGSYVVAELIPELVKPGSTAINRGTSRGRTTWTEAKNTANRQASSRQR